MFTVPLKAGSMVFFDSRLFHRSTTPSALDLTPEEAGAARVSNEKISEQNSKYTIYWEAGNHRSSTHYMENCCRRAMTDEIVQAPQFNGEYFYTNFLPHHYPTDYPKQYINAHRDYPNIEIATLIPKQTKTFKAIRECQLTS